MRIEKKGTPALMPRPTRMLKLRAVGLAIVMFASIRPAFAGDPPTAEQVRGWIADLDAKDEAKFGAAKEALLEIGPEGREVFDAGVKAVPAEAPAAERLADIRRDGLLGSLECADGERLIDRFWKGHSTEIEAWFLERYPRLATKGRDGAPVEILKTGGKVEMGDTDGRLAFSTDPKEVGKLDPGYDEKDSALTIGDGQFGILVRRSSKTWSVAVGPLEEAGFVSRLDGTRSLKDAIGKLDPETAVHGFLVLSATGAVEWLEKAAEAKPNPVCAQLAALAKKGGREEIVWRVLPGLWGE